MDGGAPMNVTSLMYCGLSIPTMYLSMMMMMPMSVKRCIPSMSGQMTVVVMGVVVDPNDGCVVRLVPTKQRE